MRPLFLGLPLVAALGLAACLSDSARTDPYAGMTCEQKIAAIAKEVREDPSIRTPAAKASRAYPDTARPDTAMPDTARKPIRDLRGYPPVVGLDSLHGSGLGMVDSRSPSDTGKVGSSTGITWIPPVGFDSMTLGSGTLPDSLRPKVEVTTRAIMPKSISAVQVVTATAYKARVRVHDFRNGLIREFRQEFGYQGELDNPNRRTAGGLVSYLAWDNKDASGRTVQSGVYLWRIRLEMESGEVIEKSARIGFIGEECRPAP